MNSVSIRQCTTCRQRRFKIYIKGWVIANPFILAVVQRAQHPLQPIDNKAAGYPDRLKKDCRAVGLKPQRKMMPVQASKQQDVKAADQTKQQQNFLSSVFIKNCSCSRQLFHFRLSGKVDFPSLSLRGGAGELEFGG